MKGVSLLLIGIQPESQRVAINVCLVKMHNRMTRNNDMYQITMAALAGDFVYCTE